MSGRSVLASARGSWLPSGRALDPSDFALRHRIVCVLLALHLPVLLLVAGLTGVGVVRGLLELVPVALLLLAALRPVNRRAGALSGTLGLMVCSALVVQLSHGMTEAHFHYFIAVALVALYQDWAVYAAAIAFVSVQHLLFGLFSPGSVDMGMPGDPWLMTAVHAGAVLAESVVLVLFWHASERTRARAEGLQQELTEGQSSVRARLEETDRIRRDLIGTVSHEFRTPLTGIRGAALTLLKRGDRLDEDARSALLRAVLEQQERLSRLLENMLTASQATAADALAVADVHAVATEVAMLARATRPGARGVNVLVEPRTVARIHRRALHQVLANLVDNALVHGRPGTLPLITGGTDERGAWVAVSNEGTALDAQTAGRLFEPFAQADSGPTRDHEGLGMGLYVVRRLIEVHDGHVEVRCDAGWLIVEIRLSQAVVPVPEARSKPPADLPAS